MTTDYRALCAELLSRLEESDDYILKEEGTIALADRARAALAQPEPEGRPAPAPAEGEVTELVAWLRMYGATGRQVLDQTPWTASQLTRAADLLEQCHPAPVPVAERLPGPEDCDAEGRCWWGLEESDDYEACWTLRKMHGIPFDNTRWLPATALPLPQGEVRP